MARNAIVLAELELQGITGKLLNVGVHNPESGLRVNDLIECLCIAESDWDASGGLPIREWEGDCYVGESVLREQIRWVRPQGFPGPQTTSIFSPLPRAANS
jgi:hypothetical protein